jgi:hypothetical protein
MSKINQDELKKLLFYDHHTGEWFWIVNKSNIKIGEKAGTPTNGYLQIQINKTIYKGHRLALLYMTGKFPDGHIDHINHIGLDNRWCNLRQVSRSENMKNMSLSKSNTSGYSGVSRILSRNAWQAQVVVNRKIYSRKMNDNKYGGKDLSFMAACFHVANKRIDFGFHENHGRKISLNGEIR